MTPNTQISVTLSSELQLEQALKNAGVENPATVTKLTIAGTMMYKDCRYIGEAMAKTLQELDISNASLEVNYIGGFRNCSSLTSIILPNSAVTIGGATSDEAFSHTGLTSITIPNSVVYIGRYAFTGCKYLTSVTIPNSVTEIGEDAFSGCSALTSFTIPNSISEIRDSTFSDCKGLTVVTIPSSVKIIGAKAFEGCTSLTSITIPSSVTGIGEGAFNRCNAVITVHPDNPVYTSRNGKIVFKKIKNVSGRTDKLEWSISNRILTIKAENEDYL